MANVVSIFLLTPSYSTLIAEPAKNQDPSEALYHKHVLAKVHKMISDSSEHSLDEVLLKAEVDIYDYKAM